MNKFNIKSKLIYYWKENNNLKIGKIILSNILFTCYKSYDDFMSKEEDKDEKESSKSEEEKDKKPVKIEFFESSTCPRCANTRPMIAEAKKIYGDDIEIFDINIDGKEGQLAAKMHNIKATPEIRINNEIKFRGAPRKKEELFENIEKHLDDDAKKRAGKKKKQQKKRVNMMYS